MHDVGNAFDGCILKPISGLLRYLQSTTPRGELVALVQLLRLRYTHVWTELREFLALAHTSLVV